MKSLNVYTYLIITLAIAILCKKNVAAQHNITEYNIPLPYGVEANTHNGNVFYQQSDLSIPGIGMDIDLTFTYNSIRGNTDMGCGKGWTTNYGMMYSINPNTGQYTIERSDGQRHKFKPNGGSFDSPKGNFETFSEYAPGQFLLTMRDGTKYYFDDANHRKLTKIEDRNGNTCDLSYNANGEINQVTSSCGANISLTWSDGYMVEVQDASEMPARLYQYEYTGDLLTKYTDPEGYFEEYTYNNRGKMIALTNKRGHTLNLTYNAFGAMASALTSLSSCTIDYDTAAMTTTVTEPVGNTIQSTTYRYNAQKQLLQKIGNCCGFNVQYNYDADNNITRMIDANGHLTDYEYNSMGQVIKETDALGNFITYSYGTPFNLVTSMTDKNGVNYIYTYDANGNLINSSNPIFSESYTYNTDVYLRCLRTVGSYQ